jgi:hypothetical protein
MFFSLTCKYCETNLIPVLHFGFMFSIQSLHVCIDLHCMVKMLLNKSQCEYMPVSTNLNLGSLQLSYAQGHINLWFSCTAWYFKATEFYVYIICLLTDIFVVHRNVLRKWFSSTLSLMCCNSTNTWICTAGKLWWSCRRIIKEAVFMNSFQHEIHVITVEHCTENTASLVQIPAGKCNWGKYLLFITKIIWNMTWTLLTTWSL